VSLFRSEIIHDPDGQDRVRAWVAALRHGCYRQGREQLRVGRRFCCLGVACDQHDPRGWRQQSTGAWSYLCEWSELPRGIADDYHLRTTDGRYGLRTESLAADNDRGRSFAEIADFIERELEAVLAAGIRRAS
jgi:hypothetical protein